MRKEEIRRFLQSLVLSSSWTSCHSYFPSVRLGTTWFPKSSRPLWLSILNSTRWLTVSAITKHLTSMEKEDHCWEHRVQRLCLASTSVFSCKPHVTSLLWRPLMVLNLSVLESELEFPATSRNLLLPCSSSSFPHTSTLSTTDLITTDFPVENSNQSPRFFHFMFVSACRI